MNDKEIKKIKPTIKINKNDLLCLELLNKSGFKEEISKGILDSIHKHLCKNKVDYIFFDVCKKFIINEIKTNTDLIDKLNNGESFVDLPKYTLLELNPQKWKKTIDFIQTKNDIINSKVRSALYVCGKCKGNITTYFERQDRSCDEGMTNHIECITCGNRWTE